MRSLLVVILASAAATAAGCSKKSDAPAPDPTPNPNPTSDPSPNPDPTPSPDPNPDPSPDPTPDPTPTTDPAAAIAEAAAGDLTFAARLHDALRVQPGNLFVSPASIRTALAVTALGARGDTAAEMTKVLGLPPPASTGFVEIERSFAGREDATVSFANGVWPQQGSTLVPAFVDRLALYRVPIKPVDYAGDREGARKTINRWVAEATADRIPDLLQPIHVPASTRLIVTNAIWFKAAWAVPFQPAATQDAAFTTDDGRKVTVPMMAATDRFDYTESDVEQALRLAYADRSLTMSIHLPKPGHTLAEVEARMLNGVGVIYQPQRVAVRLPRWKIAGQLGLAKTLTALGMPAAFTVGTADFSGIDGTRALVIGDVVHEAVITVDEAGTEAAAATAVVAIPGSAPPADPPRSFVADHAFAFFIRDATTGVLLFAGRVADPSAAPGAARNAP